MGVEMGSGWEISGDGISFSPSHIHTYIEPISLVAIISAPRRFGSTIRAVERRIPTGPGCLSTWKPCVWSESPLSALLMSEGSSDEARRRSDWLRRLANCCWYVSWMGRTLQVKVCEERGGNGAIEVSGYNDVLCIAENRVLDL